MKSPSRLTGSLVLLTAGVVVCWVVLSDDNSANPIAIILGAAVVVAGLFGLYKECRDRLNP